MRRLFHSLLSRPGQFLLQGALIAMCAAFGSTLAASLFLAHAGATAIPFYYMLTAALSIPLSVMFSAIIDRWPRRVTLGALLAVYMAVAPAIGYFCSGAAYGYYALYIVISTCELLMYSLYSTLFSDYFTVTEGKRLAGASTIALGAGAVVGSLLVSLLTRFADVSQVILALPLLVGIAGAHLAWLTRREQPLDETESGAEEGVVESLKALPRLARRFPIVLLMAAAVFINVAGQCVMEFEAYSIYAIHFPDDGQLASFLGKMTAIVDVIGILIVFFVSTPLIPRLGVARMNMVPPVVNFASFLILSASSGLPAGILAHLNFYPLEHSLNVPVFSLTYNAVPHRFTGRVRVINDGIVYPLALAAAGGLLAMLSPFLSLAQLAMIGLAGAGCYAAAQWGIGRHYLRGLIEMLRSGAIDLDQVGEGFKLPDDYAKDIRLLLQDADPEMVALGLEMATRGDVALTTGEFEQALTRVPHKAARSALASLGKNNPAQAGKQLLGLIGTSQPGVRALALEAMAVQRIGLDAPALDALLEDPDKTVRAVASAMALANAPKRSDGLMPQMMPPGTDAPTLAALRVLRALAETARTVPLGPLGDHPSARVRAEALSVAALSATPGDPALLAWGRRDFAEPDPMMRAAAAELLARVTDENDLARLCRDSFADTAPSVRQAAAAALGRRGGPALSALARQLRDSDRTIAAEIMDGIGLAGPETADALLFAYLSEDIFPTVGRNLALIKTLPTDRPAWRALQLVIADQTAGAVQLVLHALSVLGYKRVLGLARTAMKADDSRTRANAVETLSSLAHRRYILPLLPFLEMEEDKPDRPFFNPAAAREQLLSLIADRNPLIQAAALTSWAMEFGAPPANPSPTPSPLVTATRIAIAGPCSDEDFPMNRLAFLKSVPLFSEMTLDHLIALDAAMTRESFMSDECVVREGDLGDKLYIVFKGEVSVRKRVSPTEEKQLAHLTSGQLFGEMSLFDDEHRSATVTAVTDLELLALNSEQFRSLASQRPDIPIQLCKVLVARLRSAIS